MSGEALSAAQAETLTAMAAGDALTRDSKGRCFLAGHLPVYTQTFHALKARRYITLTGTLGDHWYVLTEAGRNALAEADRLAHDTTPERR